VITAYDGPGGAFDTSTEAWLDNEWKVMRGYAGDYHEICTRNNWIYSPPPRNRVMITADPEFELDEISWGYKWDPSGIWLRDYKGRGNLYSVYIDFRLTYHSTVHPDSQSKIERRSWVLTLCRPYWGSYNPPYDPITTTIWGNELND
jgi:hypothetical protein